MERQWGYFVGRGGVREVPGLGPRCKWGAPFHPHTSPQSGAADPTSIFLCRPGRHPDERQLGFNTVPSRCWVQWQRQPGALNAWPFSPALCSHETPLLPPWVLFSQLPLRLLQAQLSESQQQAAGPLPWGKGQGCNVNILTTWFQKLSSSQASVSCSTRSQTIWCIS